MSQKKAKANPIKDYDDVVHDPETGTIQVTTKEGDMTVCFIFPEKNDPEKVENFKRCVAKMICESIANGEREK